MRSTRSRESSPSTPRSEASGGEAGDEGVGVGRRDRTETEVDRAVVPAADHPRAVRSRGDRVGVLLARVTEALRPDVSTGGGELGDDRIDVARERAAAEVDGAGCGRADEDIAGRIDRDLGDGLVPAERR